MLSFVARCVPVRFGETLIDRRVPTQDGRWHRLGELIPRRIGIVKDASCVPERLFPLDGGERDDLCNMVRPVLLGRVLDHVTAIALVEIHVDIGHLLTARVQEPLEDEAELDRVEGGDRQAVRHDRSRGAPPSRAGADATFLCVLDQIPHDEEVRGETHFGDDAKFVVNPLALDVVERAVTHPSTLHHKMAQVGIDVVPLGNIELRQQDLPELDLKIGAFGDPQCVVRGTRILIAGEQVAHLCSGLDVELLGVELEPVLVRLDRPRLDAEQRIVCVCFMGMGVMGVVRCKQRCIDRLCDLQQVGHDLALSGDAVVLQFDEVVVAPEDVLVHRCCCQRRIEVTLLGRLIVIGCIIDTEQLRDVTTEAP